MKSDTGLEHDCQVARLPSTSSVCLVFVWLVGVVSWGEDDLVLKDKWLHVAEHPPEHHQHSQVLHPCKLDQLPETRCIRGTQRVKEP